LLVWCYNFSVEGQEIQRGSPLQPFSQKPTEVPKCASLSLLVLVESHARIKPLAPAEMNDHPDAPQQFSVRLPNETMGLVTQIQGFRRRINQPTTLSAIVEDAIDLYYARLVEEGAIEDDDLL
jgi:hypothetical protein